jgi:hypothetical protein
VAVRVARPDSDRGAGEVDVSPAQSDEFALAEAGEGGGEEVVDLQGFLASLSEV